MASQLCKNIKKLENQAKTRENTSFNTSEFLIFLIWYGGTKVPSHTQFFLNQHPSHNRNGGLRRYELGGLCSLCRPSRPPELAYGIDVICTQENVGVIAFWVPFSTPLPNLIVMCMSSLVDEIKNQQPTKIGTSTLSGQIQMNARSFLIQFIKFICLSVTNVNHE